MNDTELRELIERAYQIEQLQTHEGWGYLAEEVQGIVNAKRRAILQGDLTHDEYIRNCAFIDGVELVNNALTNLQRRIAREKQPA